MDIMLDNPAWSALTGHNTHFANGTESVKYFASEVSPFVALKEISEDSFKELYELTPAERTSLFVNVKETAIPATFKVLHYIPGLQMIYLGDEKPGDWNEGLVDLTDEHIPEMLALTKLTNPGPFAARTIDFGHYKGIFEDGKLAAMAGQRMHFSPYAEISAVCTHPDNLGKGYARRLLLHHINRIKAAGEIPILHVRHDNERAINVYKDMGFTTRSAIYFYVIKKV